MHAFLPQSYYGRFLGKRSFGSVVNAALFAIPLPLCSCGVIPTAISLRKEGASKGATVSFLIATPQTGVDSIIATYSLMGLPFAIVRPIAALCTSLFGGALVNVADKEAPAAADCRECERPVEKKSFAARCVDALQYAYVEMMEDIGKWLVIGLVVAGLITVLVPDGWFTVFKGNTLASMIVVRKVLGMKTTVVYMLSIVLGAICFGFLVDYLQFSGSMDFLGHLSAEHACCHEPSSWFAWTCTGALLLINALVISRFTQNTHSHHSHHMELQIYHIEGMNCNHCRMSAEKALLGVEGVTNATVDLASKEAHVEGTASRDALAKAISEIGFTLVD